ncbi:hypothetical protein ASF10_08005 [Flavobacterium sp. Leaf82]|nr:hypothetical protein ASF10_08005 [Flavobacterium sp. Leaf82]
MSKKFEDRISNNNDLNIQYNKYNTTNKNKMDFKYNSYSAELQAPGFVSGRFTIQVHEWQ